MVELLEAGGDHGPMTRIHVPAEALEEVREVVKAFKLDLQGPILLDAAEKTGTEAIGNDLRKGGKEGGKEEGEGEGWDKGQKKRGEGRREGGKEGGREGRTEGYKNTHNAHLPRGVWGGTEGYRNT